LSNEKKLIRLTIDDCNKKLEELRITELEKKSELEKEILKLKADISILADKRGIIENQYNIDKELMEKQKLESLNYYNDVIAQADNYKIGVESELIKREGVCSDQEKFLLVREEFLRNIKNQLEDKLGKKIDNLVI
jgi:hypothetical protein